MMSSDRRLHERRLIEEILGERYEPHMSERSPDAPEEDPSTIEARKRADALGRSRHQWSYQGGSDKPHEASAYLLGTRVGDAVAVLDALGIERAHFLGSSWGARLGFALGERAPERVLSLVLCGNQPYAWNLESPTAQAVAAAIAASRQEGMKGFVETFETALAYRFPEPERTWTLEKNEPAALEAAWRSALVEGPVSQDLSKWRVPCLICAGEADEMHDDAKRAAEEIPGARFVSLAGHSHISAFYEADDLLLPHIVELLGSVSAKQ